MLHSSSNDFGIGDELQTIPIIMHQYSDRRIAVHTYLIRKSVVDLYRHAIFVLGP